MTTEAQPLSKKIDDGDVRRALRALYIEVPESVARDVGAIVWNHVDALTSENDRLTRQLKLATDGLERIATEHQEYRATASALDSTYSTGVTDGHRCAAQIARDTIAAVKEVANVD